MAVGVQRLGRCPGCGREPRSLFAEAGEVQGPADGVPQVVVINHGRVPSYGHYTTVGIPVTGRAAGREEPS